MEDISDEMDPEDARIPPGGQGAEPVWTYRGYSLKSSEFTTAMIHLFRAEVQRANVWRQRLDTTTNWAVVSTGGVITFAFGNPQGHHALIILSTLLVTAFLLFEARRYRYYHLWSYRVRLMETEFFSNMLVAPFTPSTEWANRLSASLRQPQFTISLLEAFGKRLLKNYLAIFTVLFIAWVGKLWLHPTNAGSWAEIVQRAGLGALLPGEFVWTGMIAFWVGMVILAFWTMKTTSGEVLARRGLKIQDVVKKDDDQRPPRIRRSKSVEPQAMALIVTDKPEDVAHKIMDSMHRGMTGLTGKGMYSGKPHHVLLCALTAHEITRLKMLVAEADQGAFVVILSANEILGKNFVPLYEPPS